MEVGYLKKVVVSVCLLVSCALSDVVFLSNKILINGMYECGKDIISGTFVDFVLNSGSDEYESVFPRQQEGWKWQMLGFAVLFDKSGEQKLYVAKKRSYVEGVSQIPNNNPGIDGNFVNLFNYSAYMHTERQLVIAALQHKIGLLTTTTLNSEAMDIQSTICMDKLNMIFGLQGDLHIYTLQNPCQNSVKDNGNFSCIMYYNALAGFVRNLNLHIYLPKNKMRLNRDFFKDNPCAVKNLCNFIKNNIINTGLQMNNEWLQMYSAKSNGYENLIENKNSDWDVVSAQKAGTVNVIVTCVNNVLLILVICSYMNYLILYIM